MVANVLPIFTAAPHREVLILITQITILLLTARTLGEIMRKFGQPSVVGELLAGILLGPSVLGNFFPAAAQIIIPSTPVQGYLLEVISLLGAIFLLLITGLETDIPLIRRHARTALGVSFGGILTTFVSGFILGQLLPEHLLNDPGKRLVFSLFMATAMSISAIPVIAKVLIDLKMTRRDIGQIILAAGMSDDTVGWVLLSIVAGLAAGTSVATDTILLSVGKVAGFLIFSFTIGRWLVRQVFNFVQDRMLGEDRLLTLVIIFTFGWAALTQFLHLEPVLGAFVSGIVLGQILRLPRSVYRQIESIALGIFAPIFFAVAGLKVNVLNLLQPDLLLIAFLVILIATLGKISGTYLGARLIGKRDHWTALSFGAALNARGAMEIIVATVGLSIGVLSQSMFSIIVLMAMTTSLSAPFALRWVLRRIKPAEEELKRLEKEERFKGSPVHGIHRVLVPLRRGLDGSLLDSGHGTKAQILRRLASKNELSLTLLSVCKRKEKQAHQEFLNRLAPLFPGKELFKKVEEAKNVVQTILDESYKNYDLLFLGGSDHKSQSKYLFSAIIDTLMRLSPCSTMVVHQADNVASDWSPRKILVPTNGASAAKHAAELAFLLASSGEEKVTILHVLETMTQEWPHTFTDNVAHRQWSVGERMVDELKELGQLQGVETIVSIQEGAEPDKVILDVAQREQMDLIILGTDLRPASDRLFLGPRVENILRNATCPVIILNTR